MLLVGLVIMSLGVAFSIKAGLGTSPVSSDPYVLSENTGLTVGQTTIIFNCGLVLLQILLLRRRFQLIQLVQVPVAIAFGYLCDFSGWVLSAIQPANYLQQWIFCILGILLVNLKIVPESSEVYGTLSTYCIPISMSLYLMDVDIKSIIK